ncbi:MAG: GNAT family N-acyltransferase [bacterium]
MFRLATPEDLKLFYKLRYEVYKEQNYIDPSIYPEPLETDEFDKKSLHIIARLNNERDKVVGGVRLIVCDTFPMESHFPIDDKKVPSVEVSRLVVKKGSNENHDVMIGLLIKACEVGFNHGLVHWYAAADVRLIRLLRSLNIVFHRLGGKKEYMGSKSVSIYINIYEAVEHYSRRYPERIVLQKIAI